MKYLFLLALLVPLCGCLNRLRVVKEYQLKATKACEAHHDAATCRPLPYPSEQK